MPYFNDDETRIGKDENGKAYYVAKNRGKYAEKKNDTSVKSVGVVKKAIDKLVVGGIIKGKDVFHSKADQMFEVTGSAYESNLCIEGGISMKKLDFYWAANPDWWEWESNGNRVVRPDAPQEAQDSYKHYLEQCRKFDEIYGEGNWE